MSKTIHLKIKRQDSPQDRPRWEEFKVPYRTGANVVSVLMEIQRNPVNAQGQKTTAVVWECNCLEEVCGACTMIINGKPRQACSALIDQLTQPIVLEPLTKFPVIRDLMVDRSIMFENLKKVKAWIDIDGTYDLGPGPKVSQEVQEKIYPLSRCMTCGCCMEACPNVNPKSKFIGPAPIAQVRLFNAHPTGAMSKGQRLESLMGEGGIAECGNAQNCVRVCPKEIPLTASIADVNRQVTLHSILRWLDK
ncbi:MULTISPECIES: succinate dehydrogenase iron-sulfur subunit [Carboxydocella]|uniref:succinate dehydrogenase n=2 Tax=Carboxydocella TaxID=178898 RepID=A0A1T4N3F9_9FIRM|nr:MULTISPECIES: succinate dehydrogenase iron-sulfur subunit [Carboxydocella]AVX20897.1 succinate dehydrogenase / fumarate reductase iron-sulfur subunit [Carboxydocella thermautotrophica]AVX31312.1 succinate dehydrogenase / fumarate reductase iron-sulfur subunit [Carboxydocella thermautotrophica]SJZ73783.1 succinate dehydrogenase subunit B [Carboxydocella sporoproducens DSM 16521]GAW29941.1 succinate dehydrogenase iron-sulfur subunit [Carboxydocella sp. ULO1]GAW30457.1 succinate dehydrogenase 